MQIDASPAHIPTYSVVTTVDYCQLLFINLSVAHSTLRSLCYESTMQLPALASDNPIVRYCSCSPAFYINCKIQTDFYKAIR